MKRILILSVLAVAVPYLLGAQTLNVASYNIRLQTKSDYEHGDGWTQRVDALCDVVRFSDFDIFGAQEVRHVQLEDMLERLPGYAYVGVGRDDGEKGGEYSPVFYKRERLKLLDGGTFWLSETPDRVSKGWDAVCMRICSWGHFEDLATGCRFWFFNLHMDHRGKVARHKSAELVLERIGKMCGRRDNVILTGDFNVAQDDETYALIAESGVLNDAYEVAEFRFAPTGTFNAFKPENWTSKRIDHIWVSDRARVLRYGVLTYHYWEGERGSERTLEDFPKEAKAEKRTLRLPSDHYPVNAVIEFPKCGKR